MEDTETREVLKSKEYRDKVLVLPEDYYEPLFKQIQASTALLEYFGELESEIFEIDGVLFDSLAIKIEAQHDNQGAVYSLEDTPKTVKNDNLDE